MLVNLKKELEFYRNPDRAKISQKFFKTGIGEYGEGDIFIGLTVPESRKLAEKYVYLSLDELSVLLNSKIHEQRLIALMILVEKYDQNLMDRKTVFDFYLENRKFVNNWDLVDSSADKIVGRYLSGLEQEESFSILSALAKSESLWDRRISIISTLFFIRQDQFDLTLKISEMLLSDKEDLIHKAVGWMLREVGKRNQKTLEKFLKKYNKKMPRTMLRYAIEKFDEELRQKYLGGEI